MMYAWLAILLMITGCATNQNTGKEEVTYSKCVDTATMAQAGMIAFVCPYIQDEDDRLICIDSADTAHAAALLNCRLWATPDEDLALPDGETLEEEGG